MYVLRTTQRNDVTGAIFDETAVEIERELGVVALEQQRARRQHHRDLCMPSRSNDNVVVTFIVCLLLLMNTLG